MGGTMLPRLPEKMEAPFVLLQKGICLGINRSSLPTTLGETCLQRHVTEVIRYVSGLITKVVSLPVPGSVAVISKTGYCRSRSGHVV